jgi:hypothetical protein
MVDGSEDPQLDRCPPARAHRPTAAPIVARIVWEDDGEELIETVAAGWSGQFVYVRLPDRRYRLTSVAEHGGRSTALEDPGGPVLWDAGMPS